MIFQLGNDHLFNLFNIPNGCFAPDMFLVYNLQYGRKRLSKLQRTGKISRETAADLERQMVDAGLLESEADVFSKIKEWVAPIDHEPILVYRCCTCDNPLAHGPVLWGRFRIANKPPYHFTLFEYLIATYMQVVHGKLAPVEAACLLKQVVECDLAQNKAELYKRYLALDSPIRDKLQGPRHCQPTDPVLHVVSALEEIIERKPPADIN